MRPIQIISSIETFNDRVVIHDHKIRNYEDGTRIDTLEIRSYPISMYGPDGKLDSYPSKGNILDLWS